MTTGRARCFVQVREDFPARKNIFAQAASQGTQINEPGGTMLYYRGAFGRAAGGALSAFAAWIFPIWPRCRNLTNLVAIGLERAWAPQEAASRAEAARDKAMN